MLIHLKTLVKRVELGEAKLEKFVFESRKGPHKLEVYTFWAQRLDESLEEPEQKVGVLASIIAQGLGLSGELIYNG